MQNTVNRIISYAAADCEVMDTVSMTHKYQAQISLIAIQFKWTSDSEDALFRAKAEKGIIKATNKKHQQRLTDLGSSVRRYRKPTFTKPAPVDLRHQIATECDAVIEALAD